MIVPEPCGYAVLLLIANIQKTWPSVRPDKKQHGPVGVPPSGLLTSLRLLVRCLPPATTRRTGGGGRREKEGSGIQAQLNHLGCLLVDGVTTSSSLSAIWRATIYPPTRCLRMSHRVRLAALVGSFTAISKSRCVRFANANRQLLPLFEVPQHVLYASLLICRPLSAIILSTLLQVWSGSSFGPRSRDRWLAVSPSRLSRCCVLAAWYSSVGDSGVSLL
jgi:hypothetical protein